MSNRSRKPQRDDDVEVRVSNRRWSIQVVGPAAAVIVIIVFAGLIWVCILLIGLSRHMVDRMGHGLGCTAPTRANFVAGMSCLPTGPRPNATEPLSGLDEIQI